MSKEININLKPKRKTGRPRKNEPEVERPGSMLEYYDEKNIITGWCKSYSPARYRKGKSISPCVPVRSAQLVVAKATRVTRNV